jgi:hypothetical protein
LAGIVRKRLRRFLKIWHRLCSCSNKAASLSYEVTTMNPQLVQSRATKTSGNNGALLLGTGLALASMILIPALATRIGLGASVTGALRMAVMKAGHQAIRG